MKFYLIFSLLILGLGSLQAQNDSIEIETDSILIVEVETQDTVLKSKLWQNFKYDVKNMGGGFANAFTQPTRWRKDDYIKLGATFAGVALAYATDKSTNDYFHKQSEDIPDVVKDFGWYFGSPQVNYGVTGAVYTIGLLTDNESLRQTGVLMITSASAAGLIQQVMKSLSGRARPSADEGPHYFKPFGGSSIYRSFPSGHTVLSVTTMYALSKQFSSPWLKGGCYLIGSVAPVSRLWQGAHWLSDVLLSTAMSIAIVEGVDSYLKRNERYKYETKPTKKISWDLVMGPGQVGIVGSF